MQTLIRAVAVAVIAAWGAAGIAQDEGAPAETPEAPPGEAPAPATPPMIPVDVGDTQAVPATTELDTITVTAQKRVQRLVDVPINVSAVSRDDIRTTRIEQVRDLAGYITNLDIKEQVPGGIPVVSIRGVGLDDFSSTNSPAAGIYVDQVTLSSLALMSFDLFDVERIELLKGPQGTLYGRNSTAGAINVLTAAPTGESEGYVRGGYADYKTSDLEGMYNLPLGDAFAVRVAARWIKQDEGFWSSRSGAADAYTGPGTYSSSDPVVRDLGLRDVLQGRVRLGWDASETLRLDLKVESLRQRSEMGQPEMFGTMCGGGAQPIDPDNCTDFLGYTDTDRDPYTGHWRGEFPYDIDQTAATLLAEWDLGFGALTAVTGRVDFERDFHIDSDAGPAEQFDFYQADTVEQLTQEVRLAGTADLGDWLLGAYYGEDTIVIDTQGRHGDLIPGESSQIDADQDTESMALFANMDWRLGRFSEGLEKFSVTTGLRYTDETRDYVGGTTWAFEIPGTLDNTFEDSSISDKNWSWKAGLNYKPAGAHLLYASASKGVKSGGYFAGVTNAQNQLEPYDPEQLTAYEIGYKLAGPLSVNASAFLYDYKDKQTFMRSGGAVAQFIGNVPEAECRGLDAEATWRALDGLSLTGGFGLLDTELGAFVGPGGNAIPKGNQLPNAPELTWVAKVRYELPLAVGLVPAIQADAHYSDATYKEATNDELIKSGEYTILNARLSLGAPERTWEVALWGRNLTDELYVSQGLDVASFGLGNRNYNAPRTVGAELTWNF